MAKRNKPQNEVHVIWNFITCAVLYAAICYFNGPDKQHELSQESVRKFAMYISVAWFFISIIILRKQGTRVVLFKSKKNKAPKSGKTPAPKVVPPVNIPKKPIKGEDSIIIKDPATGAERLFNKDPETGDWVSDDGQSVLDPDKLPEWYDQRADDRSWIDNENEKIKNREGWLDKKLAKEEADFKAEQAKIDAEYETKLKNLKKYGSYTDDPEEIRKIIKRNQELEALNAKIQNHYGNTAAFFEGAFTILSKTCDYGVDVLAEMTGPVGKHVIKNVYITGRNVASKWSEAVNYEKDEWEAVKRGGIDSLIDMGQNYAGKNYQMVANVAGDAAKGGMDAYEKGESILGGIVDGATTGYARTKVGQMIDSGFGKLSKEYMKGEAKKLEFLRGKLESGQISQNVYKGIRQVQTANASQNLKLINKGAKTVVEDMANDLTKWVING